MKAIPLPQPPQLTTPRITLRSMAATDVDDLFAIYSDAEVMRYASDPPMARRSDVGTLLESVERCRCEGVSLEWAVVANDSGVVIGTCGLHSFDWPRRAAEVGCLLARGHWGRGLMSEALGAVLAFARQWPLDTLIADIDAPNRRSIRLFSRMGFVHHAATHYHLPLRDPQTLVAQSPTQ
ncbi:GNAT family N-acetyltransferase [Tahibacter amnicola]|uniref:GNAT family N-acetyltransferase n=1 Tax=Tahibacter amnicola TaxID=2976241 RepID=A0ABY6BCG4_9GAMM|nr:GNAT family N-acetyltransferase [Tahibacter amnicola]UXI67729.1 GNAT family N-acetyltransferase [Tahibacter amnicola]